MKLRNMHYALRFTFHVLAILSSALLFVSCSKDGQQQPKELIVFGAMSLTDALTEISQRFEVQEGKGIKVYCNFAGSSILQRQIEKGAPADVFISASPKQIDALQGKGLIHSDTRQNVLTNRLVLVTHTDVSLSFANLQTLVEDSIKRIAIGEPNSVPAGVYGKEALINLGIWKAVQRKLVTGLNVRATLAYVESGNADVGIVYQTDATISKKVKVLYQFPDFSHTPIVYPAVVIKGSAHESLARAFVEYLKTSEATELFKKYGFSIVK
ncbi:molybdate ABC transporter substrate-binding protein [Candidatus Poribacteria bacterium]|nr:molybdate ABC transporter substrate-binding protein [Candidatus Poribacteria bacterium]